MDIWKKRAPEIGNLLNPFFCSVVIYYTAFEYQKKKGAPMPFTLVYLILPIILHKNTRERINSKTNMIVWLQKYPDVLIGFHERARDLVLFTNEAIEFLIQGEIITLQKAYLNINKILSRSGMKNFDDTETLECFKKAEHLGRWFAQISIEENIYIAWGVKP
jgi:hypothetical protein